ncbi:MAG: DNRLRE domain-containing protein, partial [Thermodesulfobacteriota bacterium]
MLARRILPLALCCAFLLAAPWGALAETVDIGTAADAGVALGFPGTSYGSSGALYVASASGGAYRDERTWLRFDLEGQLPPGAVITSARLRLFCSTADSADTLLAAVHGSANDDWQEDTLTWSSQPAVGAELSQRLLMAGAEDEWLDWDVTAFVQAQQAGDQQASLVVKAVTEGDTTWRTFAFDSRESSAARAPRLRIEYSGSWPTGGGFSILHMNDAHARLFSHQLDVPGVDDQPVFEEVGGAAPFAAQLLARKAANPESLVLDAGDISEGSPLGDLRGNGGMVDFYNLLDAKLKALGGRGIDAAVVGNHDLRTGEMLANLRSHATYPVISLNVCSQGTQSPYFTPSVTVTVNGTQVGIIGYTNDESSYMDPETDALIDVVKVVWEDADPATIDLKDAVAQLRSQGCAVVILLSHIGQSRVVAGPDALVRDDGGVRPPEVVIAGHWHSWAETVWQPAQLHGKTLVAEAASYLQYLGELTVTGDGRYVQAVQHPIRTAGLLPDPEVLGLLASLEAEYTAASPPGSLHQVIGYSAVDLRLDKDKWWTMNEYPWSGDNTAGAWISDAMVWKAGQLGFPSQLAMQSGGGIRRDVPAGPITFAQIYEAYPWQDDAMVRIVMTGQEIWDLIEDDFCGTSISQDWLVTAEDGIIQEIRYQGTPISLAGTYQVLVSEYMYLHQGPWTDTTPEYLPSQTSPVSIRQAVIDYTGQFDLDHPMPAPGPRYDLDTELAGGFRAVVTMLADTESEPYYEAAFIRLLSATDDTVARRSGYGLSGLVNAGGSINPAHQFAESMLYRSHLGFQDGALAPGDLIEVRVEGGFHGGNPQLVDQEGITASGQEMTVTGHDPDLARPEYQPDIASFWDEEHENHLVLFYATKTGASQVRDAAGQEITVYQPGGHSAMTLPGNSGDLLELTGVNTYEHTSRRFRCRSAAVAFTSGYPPQSRVDPVLPEEQTSSPLVLTATASDPVEGGTATVSTGPVADAQVVAGSPASNYGSRTYLYVQSAATGSYLNERSWLRFDLAGLVPAGATVTGARLKLYCWKAGAAALAAAVHGANDDSWAENGLTWANQPALDSALSTTTLAAGQTAVWYTWDVTSFLQAQLGAGDDLISLVVKPEVEGSATTLSYAFDSKEYATASLRPVLEVDYQTGASGGSVATVDFRYRFAADGLAWGGWIDLAQDAAAPWTAVFAYPHGAGFYEFLSLATDADGNVEPAPVLADARVHFLDPDTDGDGIPDRLETGCTSPGNPDSDADGLADGVEDANHNGVVDSGETSPCLADTDGDGFSDGDEVTAGSDPLDPGSSPQTPAVPGPGPWSLALLALLLLGLGILLS